MNTTISPPARKRTLAVLAAAAAAAAFSFAMVEQWPGRGHLVHLAEPDRLAAFASQCLAPGRPDRPAAPSWRST